MHVSSLGNNKKSFSAPDLAFSHPIKACAHNIAVASSAPERFFKKKPDIVEALKAAVAHGFPQGNLSVEQKRHRVQELFADAGAKKKARKQQL